MISLRHLLLFAASLASLNYVFGDVSGSEDEGKGRTDDEKPSIGKRISKYRSERATKATASLFIDYAFSIDNFSHLLESSQTKKDTKKAIIKAIKVFIKPMQTYATAQGSTSPKVLRESLRQLLSVLRKTSHKSSSMDLNDWSFDECIFSRDQVNAVLKARSKLYNAVKERNVSTGRKKRMSATQKLKLQMILNKLDSLSTQSLTTMISSDMDWTSFEQLYIKVVLRMVRDNSDLAKAATELLGKYLKTGKADMDGFNALAEKEGAGMNVRFGRTDKKRANAESNVSKTTDSDNVSETGTADYNSSSTSGSTSGSASGSTSDNISGDKRELSGTIKRGDKSDKWKGDINANIAASSIDASTIKYLGIATMTALVMLAF